MWDIRTGLISWCVWPEFSEVWKCWAWEGALWGWGREPNHWTSLGCECCDAIYWNPLSTLQLPLQKWCQYLWAKKQYFSGQGRGWDLSGCFGHLQGLSAALSHSLKGDFSLTWQAHSEIQQCQQGALIGTLPWQPLHLLPPLLLEAKNQVFSLIRARTYFLRVFSPVIKLFGSRMHHLNPFCSEKWG